MSETTRRQLTLYEESIRDEERGRIKAIIEEHRFDASLALTEQRRGYNFAVADILKAIDDEIPEALLDPDREL